ncbi:MAG: hexose kinase [Verrucomicrobiales bacterium]|nr:hexose kinase [Verrucomicrobiales bacterium]
MGTTPAAQRVMIFEQLQWDAVNRAVTTLDGSAGKSVNVAKVLQALGGRPLAVGFLGGDRGRAIQKDLAGREIATEFVEVGADTRQCVTVIDRTAGTVTELVEESARVESGDFDRLFSTIERRLPGCAALVLSGTIAPGGPVAFYSECVRLARQHGILTVVDASKAALADALRARPDVVKPNQAELAATVRRVLPDEAAVIGALQELRDRGAGAVVITSGREPVLAGDDQSVWRIANPAIKPLNPIGSGDAFTAAMTLRLAAGDDLGTACRWGAAAGAANALTPMAGEVQLETVRNLLEETDLERLSG